MADWYISSVGWTAIPQFAASGVYSVGNIVRPLTAPAFGAQYAFRCTTAGTASTEPAWPANNNATVTTGGATFTNVTGQSTYGWGAAAGNLWCLTSGGAGTARYAAGDRIFLSSDHSETSANSFQLAVAAYALIQVISVNRAGSVPPAAADALSGAAITYNGSANFTLDPTTDVYWQGVTFTLGGTGTALQAANIGNKQNYFRNCAFVFTTSITTAAFQTGGATKTVFDNTTVQFNAAAQRFNCAFPWDLQWINTPAATLGTVPTVLFANANANYPWLITCRGVDLSAVTTTLGQTTGATFAKMLFDSCRIASGVTRLGTPTSTGADELELVNCYDGTHFLAERHTPAGDVTTEFSTTMVGGATDNVGLFSHKMVSSSRSNPWGMTLDSFWMDVNDSVTGASHTATVELIASSALNNNDVRLILEYQGTSGSSLASFGDSLASVLTAAAALPTSSAPTWNNPPSTPVKQHLSVTFTAQTAGRLRALVRLGKPSTTIWVNPQITVT